MYVPYTLCKQLLSSMKSVYEGRSRIRKVVVQLKFNKSPQSTRLEFHVRADHDDEVKGPSRSLGSCWRLR